jgi:hypothetical protein
MEYHVLTVYASSDVMAMLRCHGGVDFDGSFWIIGFRYPCSTCKLLKGINITFCSWDVRILAILRRTLSSKFSARLSHRSGISKSVFTFMRSCFQSGMGAKQFSDALRVQHLQVYDELHLKYLHSLTSRCSIAEWQGEKFEAFLPYSDRPAMGFVP